MNSLCLASNIQFFVCLMPRCRHRLMYPLGKTLEASKGIGLEPKEEVDEDC